MRRKRLTTPNPNFFQHPHPAPNAENPLQIGFRNLYVERAVRKSTPAPAQTVGFRLQQGSHGKRSHTWVVELMRIEPSPEFQNGA